MIERDRFLGAIEKLVHGPLREALGFTIERSIPYYRGIAGYMIDIPLMWTRRTRFPVLFIAYDHNSADVLTDIEKQVQASKSTSYFALLIVVPTTSGTGNEANELRLRVQNSVYRNDFVVLDQQLLASIIARSSTDRLIEIILDQGVEISTLSPYVVRGPVPPNMFFGREGEIKTISQAIHHANFALVGGRRIGKSSILQRLDHLLSKDRRYHARYLNCEDIFEPAELIPITAALLGDNTEDQRSDADSLAHQYRQIVDRARRRHEGIQLVLLMDEVDQLLSFDAEGRYGRPLFKTFRALAHEGQCSFVFGGSKSLHAALHDPQSPFFNFCQDIALRPLAERSVAEIVSRPMNQLGIQLLDEESLIDRMIAITSCHPSLVQWLCDRLVRTTSTRRIAVQDLEDVASERAFQDYFLETAWGDATPLEKLVSILPNEPVFRLDDLYAAAARFGIDEKRAIRNALGTLELYALIQREGGAYRYSLKQFPRIVQESEEVHTLVEGWQRRMEV